MKRLIVIGASAGGFKSISTLLSTFQEDLNAAVFIVLHLSKRSAAEIIKNNFQKNSKLECIIPENGIEFQVNKVYIAPPDFQMLIKEEKILLTKGPHENRYRPSIDALFRTAAVEHQNRVTGIILSGMLDDGTSGMTAIKKCGGTCIVQEPYEAEFSDMPNSVLANVEVDYRVPLSDMIYVINEILSKSMEKNNPVPKEIQIESDISTRMSSTLDNMPKIGTHSDFTCPDCGGGLWKISNENFTRYRCHTGHVYTENILHQKQIENLEETIWVSIRMLEEHRNLLKTSSLRNGEKANADLTVLKNERINNFQEHIDRLKSLLYTFRELPPEQDMK